MIQAISLLLIAFLIFQMLKKYKLSIEYSGPFYEDDIDDKEKHLFITILLLAIPICLTGQSIFRTACSGDLERLDSLLVSTTIDLEDDRGRSLLHWAVACKKKEVFNWLIDMGIEPNGVDNQGHTPLHVAVQYNNTEYLEYLIELQTTDDWQSLYGASLLQLAILNGNRELTERLITSGVDIDVKNERGSTALEIAQRIGAVPISEWLISQGADEDLVRKLNIQGAYMGMKEPGSKAQMFAPNFISTEEQEFGSVFSKDGTEFYFGVDVGRRSEIRYSKMLEGQWTKPQTIVSHEAYSYNDPFLSNDEHRLYFISTRASDGQGEIKDVDIWYVERLDDGWSEPINVGSNINSSGNEYYISFTDDGTMYFASDGLPRQDTSRSDHDIYYAEFIDDEFQKPVLLDSTVNSAGYEADVFVAPDESYLIYCSTRDGGYGRGDLYISFKNAQGEWTDAVNMGAAINTKHYEYCPFVTKDGKYLFYTSNQDIYWISTAVIEVLMNE